MILMNQTRALEDVRKVLRDSLGLDEIDSIHIDSKLTQLNKENKDVDGTDMLDIYYELGLKLRDHTSGERLTEEGIAFLKDVGNFLLRSPFSNYAETNHFYNLSRAKTTNEFIKQLTVNDLVGMKQYTEMLKQAA